MICEGRTATGNHVFIPGQGGIPAKRKRGNAEDEEDREDDAEGDEEDGETSVDVSMRESGCASCDIWSTCWDLSLMNFAERIALPHRVPEGLHALAAVVREGKPPIRTLVNVLSRV